MVKVFMVILNWNGFEDTYACLESLSKSRHVGIQLELVIVDNGSTDGSAKKLSSLKFEGTVLKIIKNSKNLGFCEGNNIGIQYAMSRKADFVVVLNNDTLVSPDSVKELTKFMIENPGVAACSPKIYFAKGFEFHSKRYQKKDLGNVLWYAGGVIDWNNVYGANLGVDEVDRGQYDSESETDFFTGACAILRVKALEDVGIFDEKYFMYLEDADLSQRMKRRKLKVKYFPNAKIWHKVARSSAIGGDLNDYFITRNRMMFGISYASIRTKLALYREGLRLLLNGRKWQKLGIHDYLLGRFGKGSWK